MRNCFFHIPFMLTLGVLASCTSTTGQFPSGSDAESVDGNMRPQIFLEGQATIAIDLNDTFVEPGARASDMEDGDISYKIYSNSSGINTKVAGIYTITYQVQDSSGLAAVPAARRIVIKDPNAPAIANTPQNSLY